MPSEAVDTDADARRTLDRLYREMTAEAKLRRVRELTLTVHGLALAGLRSRHPAENDRRLLLRLARIRLGEEAFGSAYGGLASDDGS